MEKIIIETNLDSINWPITLPSSLKRQVWQLGKSQSLTINQELHQPSPHWQIVYVEQGAINLYSPSLDMESVIGSVLTQGMWAITEIPDIPGHCLQICALQQSQVRIFEGDKFTRAANEVNQLHTLHQACLNQCRQQLLRCSLLAIQSKAAHLAHTLIQLLPVTDQQHNIKVTQSQLSELLGTRRQNINELLQLFQHHKLVRLGRGKITILDANQLRSMSESATQLGDSQSISGTRSG